MNAAVAPTTDSSEICGWVLFDGSCGFCNSWVLTWEKTLRKVGFGIATLQSDWVVEKIKLPADQLTYNIRLLFKDGTHIEGADVYRHVMKRIWWTRPFYLLSITPGLSAVFDWAYREFANHRHRISHTCGLPPR